METSNNTQLPAGTAVITVEPRRERIRLPHYLLAGGRLLGVIKDQPAKLLLPGGGRCELTVRSLYRFIEGSANVCVVPGEHVTVTWTDHERWWNLLFTLDLVLWFVELFVTIPAPWDVAYSVASNGFFAVWLIRLWVIRKRYFKLTVRRSGAPTQPSSLPIS